MNSDKHRSNQKNIAQALLLLSASICVHLWRGSPAFADTAPNFEKKWLSAQFFAEGAAFGDFNNDKQLDIVSGPFIYDGPDFTMKHAYVEPKAFDPLAYSDNFFAYTQDVNKDGFTDIIIIGFPGKETFWYQNPAGKGDKWTQHLMLAITDNESPMMANIVGDDTPELVCMSEGFAGYATPDASDPTKPWTFHKITPKSEYQRFTHGIGVGDINGDGKLDLLEKNGWWEQPANLAEPASAGGDAVWKKHPVAFTSDHGSSQMYAYDVDGDGDNDVITALNAHGFGLAWYEHVKNDKGEIDLSERHLILGSKRGEKTELVNAGGDELNFSQLHAVLLVDMDGDGLLDILTGKRYWAHGPNGDPEPNEKPLLYYFRLTRNEGKAAYTPVMIDDNSGVGTQVSAQDVNGDKRSDVLVGNKKGTMVFVSKAK